MTLTRKIILFLALVIIALLYTVMSDLKKAEPDAVNYDDLNRSRYEIPISDSPMSFADALTSNVDTWPTYRNEQFGFSLKYPPGWGVTNEKFDGDVWFVGFTESVHDFNFGLSITRDSLEDKIELEKGDDFLRLEDGQEVDGVKIIKVVHSLSEYYQENDISYVFVHREYGFGLRGDPWLLRLALPTLHFF